MRATLTGADLATQLVVPRETWQALGNGLRLRIIQRTRVRGVDADGRTFEPYSAGYLRQRARRGAGSRVTLTSWRAGSHMLDAIAVTVDVDQNPRVALSFATAEKATLAEYHMGEGRVDRLFFGFGDDDLDYGVAFVRSDLQRRSQG